MSQAGDLDVLSIHPEIPTSFVTNNGTAVPIANELDILGTTVAAGTTPLSTSGSGKTVTIKAQTSQALAAADSTKIGLANFDSAAFDVSATGFVQLNNGGIAATSFDVQANTAPGTDPVVPTAAGSIVVNGAAVANHSVVLETRSRAANAYNVEVQYATSAAATDATKSGVAHFNSTQFSVDANGFVALAGGGQAIDSVNVDANTGPGTDPVLPSATGEIIVTGGQVATGTVGANVIRTNSLAANTYSIEIQRTTAVAATDSTKNGVSHFNSNQFAVDASGFVSLAGGSIAMDSITPNSGTTPVVPDSNGNVSILGTGSITAVGSLNTETIQLTGLTNHAVLVGAGTSTITKVAPSATTGVALVSQGAAVDPAFGTVVVAGGGTGAVSLTGVLTGNGTNAVTANAVTQFGVVIGGASNAVGSTAVGNAGQVLQSGGAGVNPTYSTATYPLTAGTAGKVLISDGTNIISSTPTFPNASATAGKFIRSDGTNWIASTPTLPTAAGTTGKILQSNGTNYVESTPTYPSTSGTSRKIIVSDGTNNVYSTETYAVPGTTGNLMASNGTNWTATLAPSVTSITLGGGTALSNYQEGTFTPAFAGGGSNPTVSYSQQTGLYTRIGNTVICRIRLLVTSYTGGSGLLEITGLPFTCNAGSVSNPGTVITDNITFSGILGVIAQIGGTYCFIQQSTSNAASGSLQTNAVQNVSGAGFNLTLIYQV